MNAPQSIEWEEILKNAEGNLYFFMSGEAKAPNNSDLSLKDLIEKAFPIANQIHRHINIYGFNPIEGINFVCRVLPGEKVDPTKMRVTADVKDIQVVKAELCAEDVAYLMKIAGIPQLTKDMVAVDKTAAMAPPIVNPKSGFRKQRDKKHGIERSTHVGFGVNQDAFDTAKDNPALMGESFQDDIVFDVLDD